MSAIIFSMRWRRLRDVISVDISVSSNGGYAKAEKVELESRARLGSLMGVKSAAPSRLVSRERLCVIRAES